MRQQIAHGGGETARVATGENEEDGGERRQLPINEQRYEITSKQGGNGRARISQPGSRCHAAVLVHGVYDIERGGDVENQREGARDCLGAHKNKVKADHTGGQMHAGVYVPALIGRCRNQHKHPHLPQHVRQYGHQRRAEDHHQAGQQ